MRRLVIAAAGACVLVFAGSAGALAERVFRLDSGDQAFIRGTAVVCAVTQGAGTAKQVSCFRVDKAGRPVNRSYGVAIAQNGVAVVRFGAGGQSTVVFQRKQ